MTTTSTSVGGRPLAVDLVDIHKNFGSVHAVRGVSLGIDAGEIVALLGPNGAGKTTSIDMILALSQPSSGTVSVFGHAAPAGHQPRADLRRHADRRPAQGLHGRRDPSSTPRACSSTPSPSRRCCSGRASAASPTGGWQVLGRRAAAAALRHGPAARPRAAGARRADHRHGRRGPPRLLGRHPAGRRQGPDRAVRHPLPGGGRRLRRPRSSCCGTARSWPTAPPRRSRRCRRAARCGPRCPTPARPSWTPSPARTAWSCAATPS